MKKSRLYSDWFFEEWWAALGPENNFENWPALDQRLPRWEGFYRRTFVDGRWTVPIMDAMIVAHDGADLHASQGLFEQALHYLDELTLHPDLLLLDRFNRTVVEHLRGACELGAGRFEEGTGRLMDHCTEVHDVRWLCRLMFLVSEFRKGFDPELKPIIAFLVGRHFNSGPLLKVLDKASSNEESFDVLWKAAENRIRSFPRRPKPRP